MIKTLWSKEGALPLLNRRQSGVLAAAESRVSSGAPRSFAYFENQGYASFPKSPKVEPAFGLMWSEG